MVSHFTFCLWLQKQGPYGFFNSHKYKVFMVTTLSVMKNPETTATYRSRVHLAIWGGRDMAMLLDSMVFCRIWLLTHAIESCFWYKCPHMYWKLRLSPPPPPPPSPQTPLLVIYIYIYIFIHPYTYITYNDIAWLGIRVCIALPVNHFWMKRGHCWLI